MLIRYLTLDKFKWLLSDNGIYLGSAEDQTDTNEGIYDHTLISKALKSKIKGENDILWSEIDTLSKSLMAANREDHYLSCWYSGNKESLNMWKEYGNDGVALISSELQLINYLPEPLGNSTEFYKVIYDSKLKSSSINNPFRYKDDRYLFESEFRLTLNLHNYSILTGFEKDRFGEVHIGDNLSYEDDSITCSMSEKGIAQSQSIIRKKGSGYIIDYDLEEIVSEIRVSPDCDEKSVQYIVDQIKNNGLNISVRKSELSCEPSVTES